MWYRSIWIAGIYALIAISSNAVAHVDHSHTHETENLYVGSDGMVSDHTTSVHEEKMHKPVIRCRMCGAKIALKKDYMELHDESKAIESRREPLLGEHGAVHTFVNPSRMEMEVAAFKNVIGSEGATFTKKATFFEGYNWRELRCSGCDRHVGWKFHHDELQTCISEQLLEQVVTQAETIAETTSLVSELAKKKEIVSNALQDKCVVAHAGWWTYELCYRKEIRQYHQEPDGTRPSDWSMGVYKADDFLPGVSPPGGVVQDVTQYYTDGQICDENGLLRSSKVVFTCCKNAHKEPTIEDVEEPSLCKYKFTVCVPELCMKGKIEYSPAYDVKKITDTCTASFDSTHQGESIPAHFAAIRWATVISDDSSELDWARDMQLKA